jgi:anti-sigma regulatory factor (Ser/Thr protein kinase)
MIAGRPIDRMSSPSHRQVFPARMSELPAVAAFTTAAATAAGLHRAAGLRLVLLVEELFTNTVAHGHGQDSEAPVHVAFDAAPGCVRLVYEDTGPPHDPFAAVAAPDALTDVDDRPVGGLGVLLVASLGTEVEYRRADGVNRIALVVRGGG